MNLRLIFTLVGLYLFSANAQKNYVISPSKTIHAVAPANTLNIFNIYQDNIDSNSITLQWKKLFINMPVGWDYSLCDLGTCYGLIPDSSQMAEVIKGGRGFLGFDVNPQNYSGIGVAKFYVYEKGKFSQGDTCTYIINAGNTSNISPLVSAFEISIFPNPATDLINIATLNTISSEVKIIDATGRTIETITLNRANTIVDVSSYSKGIYFLTSIRNDATIYHKFIKY